MAKKAMIKIQFTPITANTNFQTLYLSVYLFNLIFFFYITSFHVQIASPNDTTGWAGTGSKADCVHFFPGPYLVTSGC